MSKDELADKTAQVLLTNNGVTLSKEVIKKVLSASMSVIKEAVADQETVMLRGFGKYAPVLRKAKKARNISTGETIDIPAHVVPAFTPSDEFKAQVASSLEVLPNDQSQL